MQPGIARRCKDDPDLLPKRCLDELLDIPTNQRNVDAEGKGGLGAAFLDMLAQQLRLHRARADQSQSAGIRDRRGEPVTAAPDHSRLNDRIANIEQCGDTGI